MKKAIHSIVIFISFLIISCGEETTNSPVDQSKDIMPLSFASRWSYILKDYDSIGQATRQNNIMLYVLDTVYYNNHTWFILNNMHTYSYFDGWLHGPSKKGQLLKYPVQQGETFYDSDSNFVTVASLSRQITVPAGKFKCIEYKVLYHEKDDYWYCEYVHYSPGVGLIKSEVYDIYNIIVKSMELTSYSQ